MLKAIPELLSRFVIGFIFIGSGWGKFQTLPKVIGYFESLHIPFASIQAPMVSAFELICGLMVLLGIFTRLASLPLIGIMGVAILTAKLEDINDLSTAFSTSEVLYIVILTWLATHGSKYLALDHFICKRNQLKRP